ncbi:hypothetical protein KSP40_PGU001316 [Platanthera guangdongensis]|uniref:Uncharacterized protein n=1 Tax=Platanthera guangdongensis TaxID=2320717 RepID=A0ABR2MFG8_9ASPA
MGTHTRKDGFIPEDNLRKSFDVDTEKLSSVAKIKVVVCLHDLAVGIEFFSLVCCRHRIMAVYRLSVLYFMSNFNRDLQPDYKYLLRLVTVANSFYKMMSSLLARVSYCG